MKCKTEILPWRLRTHSQYDPTPHALGFDMCTTSEDMAKKYKNGCSFVNAKSVVVEVNVPKEVRTYCPKCKQHQAHSVTLYKAGKARPMAAGARAHAREKRGYGGQKYPLQREFAKTTKKQTLKLKCKVCGYMRHKDGMRLRKLTIA